MSIFNNISGSVEYDEKLIKQWLSMYGALPRMQIKKLLNKDKDSEATNLIKGLVKRGELYEQESGVFLALDPRQRMSERIIKALWVLIYYRNKVEPDNHYPADFPSEIYFLKDNQEYEIFVLNKGEEFKLHHLKRREGVRYIIVVPTIDESYIATLTIPDVEYIYATVSYGCSGEAQVNLYAPTKVASKLQDTQEENDENCEPPAVYDEESNGDFDKDFYEPSDNISDENECENSEENSEEIPEDAEVLTTDFDGEDE